MEETDSCFKVFQIHIRKESVKELFSYPAYRNFTLNHLSLKKNALFMVVFKICNSEFKCLQVSTNQTTEVEKERLT